jgi:hypothetical protein
LKTTCEENIEEYIEKQKMQYGQKLLQKKLFYLDKSVWIHLRQAKQEGAGHPYYCVYTLFLDLVQRGMIVCPLGPAVFTELFKQQSDDRRYATASLIDELSLGFALQSRFVRLYAEIGHFLESLLGQGHLPPIKQLVWTKIPCIDGEFIPSLPVPPENQKLILQKQWYDYYSSLRLVDMLRTLGPNAAQMPLPDYRATAAATTEGKFKHADEIKDFKSAYRIEFEGLVSGLHEIGLLSQVFLRLYNKNGNTDLPKPDELETSGKDLRNLICNTSKHGRLDRKHLTSIQIEAGLYAAVRCTRSRKYHEDDFYDFEHAASALAYYDYFLTTDGPLKSLLCTKPLKYHRIYNVDILSDPGEMLTILRQCQQNK